MSEMGRVWDLLQRAYEGNVWHGPSLHRLLGEVTAEQAAARPVPGARTIWETVRHVAAQLDAVAERLEGRHLEELPRERSWPAMGETTPRAWREVVTRFEDAHLRLRRAVASFPEERLTETPGGTPRSTWRSTA